MSYCAIFERHSKEYNIEPQWLKGEFAHELITLSKYKEHESLWKTYLVADVLGLAYVVSKHGNAVRKITGVSYKNSLRESLIAWSCLGRHIKDSNKKFYTPKNTFVRDFIQKTVHGGRVICLNRNFVSSSLDETVKIPGRYYGFNLETSASFENYFDYIKKIYKKYKDKV